MFGKFRLPAFHCTIREIRLEFERKAKLLIAIMIEETGVLEKIVHDNQGEKKTLFGHFHLLGLNCLEPKTLLSR